MASLIREERRASAPPIGGLGIVALSVAMVTVFLLAPGDIALKSHAFLRGLCAQRPSHSIWIGGNVLPLDARMTGIYLGAVTMIIWLAASGQLRAAGSLPASIISILAAFVAIMAVDGFNGLLVDVQLPHAYEPSNIWRITTGGLSGLALGAALGHLFAITVWERGERRRAIVWRPRQLLIPLTITGLLAALILSGLPILYAPVAVGLIAAVVGTIWMLAVVVCALASGRAWTARHFGDISAVAIAALVASIVFIGALSWLRLAAELWLGLPKLT
jgi:uncharacterized membrane protein